MIYATSRAMLRDRVRSLRDANVYEAQRYRHIVGTPLIAAGEGGAVHAQTSFIVARIMHTGETMLFATGRYHDRIVLDGGEARFAEKIVILDSRLIDTLLAIPLVARMERLRNAGRSRPLHEPRITLALHPGYGL